MISGRAGAALIAIGGKALIREGEEGTIAQQMAARRCAPRSSSSTPAERR
jgi:hypothetical protein